MTMLEIVLRPALRFLGALLLLAATIALASDVTRWQSGVAPSWTFESLSGHINDLAPATLKSIGSAVAESLHPWVWDPVLTTILACPAWLLFFVFGSALLYVSRERRRINIFVN